MKEKETWGKLHNVAIQIREAKFVARGVETMIHGMNLFFFALDVYYLEIPYRFTSD